MSKKELLDYIDDFKKYGLIEDDTLLSGDYKTGNAAHQKMEKIFKKSMYDNNKEKFYLEVLSTAKDASTLTACCAYMMKLNIHPDKARKRLKEIIHSKDYHPILTFNAEMFLKEWDKGNIKPIELY